MDMYTLLSSSQDAVDDEDPEHTEGVRGSTLDDADALDDAPDDFAELVRKKEPKNVPRASLSTVFERDRLFVLDKGGSSFARFKLIRAGNDFGLA
mmetsp:Transcript_56332/g.115209  ORF Transcript_56332/g.115209 Transcript_56332/m.115209 type:complete len:95 (+) Transcript_56332:409-693(+)